METSLELYLGNELLFSSRGRWLHPLFELEEFLKGNNYDPRSLLLKDKIICKAAALLIVRLGIVQVRAGILSKSGKEALER